jgi:hypothetical protein
MDPVTDWRFEKLEAGLVQANGWACDGVPDSGGLCAEPVAVVGYSAVLNMRARLCAEHYRRAVEWLDLQRETGP